MNQIEVFQKECEERVLSNGNDKMLVDSAHQFNVASNKAQYSYNFKWMGRPIIQYPQDIIAMQEIIWDLKPDLIIETGIAHGGSLILYASLLELIGHGEVLGIDIDIRKHNKEEIESHSMYKRITMFEGSSVDASMIEKVTQYAKGKEKVLVLLDSNHTNEHVLAELNAYAPLVSLNSYIVVFDTIVENLPPDYMPGVKRAWGIGDNPMTSVDNFLSSNNNFQIDESIDNKILISVAPRGYLKRIK